MKLRSTTSAVIGGTLLAVLAPTAAAYADAISIDDDTSDVWESMYDDETGTESFVEAGSVLNVDVDKTRVRHLANRIVVTATYAELKKQDVILSPYGQLRFNDGPAVGFAVDTYRKWSGESVLYKVGSGDPINCAGFGVVIDYTANTVEVSTPRKCVGNPRWVEARYIATGNQEDPEAPSGYHNWHDSSLTAGSGVNGYSERVQKP